MKLHKSFFTQLILVLSLCLISIPTYANAIDTLVSFNARVNALSGHFTQTVQSKKKNQSTSGTFKILRPGLFVWDYQTPFQQLIVADGRDVWLYDKDLEQITKRSQSSLISQTPAAILSNKQALEKFYSLELDNSNNGIDYVLATPKSSQSEYQYIRIGFRGQALASMQLQDRFGNTTTLSFSNVQENPSLSSKQFQFTPPKGIDVISD